jgi:hypothetical protein
MNVSSFKTHWFNMIKEKVVTLVSIKIIWRAPWDLWAIKHMISQPKLYCKKTRSPNRNMGMVPHSVWSKGEKTNVEDVMGFIRRRINLILFRPLPPNLIPVTFVLTIRFKVMTQTIGLQYTLNLVGPIPNEICREIPRLLQGPKMERCGQQRVTNQTKFKPY